MGEALRHWGPAALAWALVLTSGSRDRTRVWLRWVLVGLACSLTVQVPAVYAALGQATGVSHAPRLISHTGMVLTAWAAQEFIARVDGRPRGPRWQTWWVISGFAVMCALFAALPDLLPQSPWVMEYCLAYAATQAPALVSVIHFGLRHARRAPDHAIRVSLRVFTAGTALGLLYLANKTVLAVSPRLGFEFPFGRTVLPGKVLPTTSYVLVLLGAALPAALGWLHHHRLYRRLGPLWRALYRADPAIALDRTTVPDVLVLRHLRLRLYRRVIEIRDGLLALQPYRPYPTARTPDAATEAATIAAALHARSTGAPPHPHPATPSGGTDLVDDTLFLSEVSTAFHRTTSGRPLPR
ncbi:MULTISPECIES: MAB_1171c family putative transporter [unclassified Saccharothrix]|uniref:MAB_1171c family putative transporter n=1 Tax=unclassified Saccharothrix TaxID=2593673 RepID=UPI00307DB3A5